MATDANAFRPASGLVRYFPVLDWGRAYSRATLANDLMAAVIVTIMLIPQSLAYAMLAGLPAEIGLYASIAPLFAYAVFGTSRALAVGPVAVVSLMTASAIGGSADPVAAALVLAALSGAMLFGLGALRIGFIANFLSHPVISGFITASGVLIAASQLKHILGVKAEGENLVALATSLVSHIDQANPITLAIGLVAAAFLFWVRKGLKPLLIGLGFRPRPADLLAKAGPVAAVAVTSFIAWGFDPRSPPSPSPRSSPGVSISARRASSWSAPCRRACRPSPGPPSLPNWSRRSPARRR